jgi:hypothetical protein
LMHEFGGYCNCHRNAYYGTSAVLGGGSSYVLGLGRDKAFGLERTWGTVAGDVVGGAVFSSILTPAKLAGVGLGGKFARTAGLGAGSGFFSNLVEQGVNLGVSGTSFSAYDLGKSALVGGLAGWAGGKVPAIRLSGVNAGRNNFASVFEGVERRILNGSASRYSVLTGSKGAVGQFANDIFGKVEGTTVEGAAKTFIQAGERGYNTVRRLPYGN